MTDFPTVEGVLRYKASFFELFARSRIYNYNDVLPRIRARSLGNYGASFIFGLIRLQRIGISWIFRCGDSAVISACCIVHYICCVSALVFFIAIRGRGTRISSLFLGKFFKHSNKHYIGIRHKQGVVTVAVFDDIDRRRRARTRSKIGGSQTLQFVAVHRSYRHG